MILFVAASHCQRLSAAADSLSVESYARAMADSTLRLMMCAPVSDDPYFAEVGFDVPGAACTWAEVVLANVDISAAGADRVANARVVVRVYCNEHHLEVPYEEAIGILERAKDRLLEGEMKVPPGWD